jgi:hypothetical protein
MLGRRIDREAKSSAVSFQAALAISVDGVCLGISLYGVSHIVIRARYSQQPNASDLMRTARASKDARLLCIARFFAPRQKYTRPMVRVHHARLCE